MQLVREETLAELLARRKSPDQDLPSYLKVFELDRYLTDLQFGEKRIVMRINGLCLTLELLPMLLLCLMAGCGMSLNATSNEGAPTAAPPSQPPALIRVATVREEKVAPEFLAVGNIRPRYTSIVASGSEGIVEEFPEEIEVGAFVEKGTLLSRLRMESTDLDIAEQDAILRERAAELTEIRVPRKEDEDEARARQQAAEVAWANARRRLEEVMALSTRNAANPTEVKDAQDVLAAAEQNRLAAAAVLARISNPRPEAVLQAEARLEAQKMHVAFLRAEREKRATKAPFEGYVVEEHTYVGQWLSKGDPIVTLSCLNEVEVAVQVDQQFIDQVSPGREVRLGVKGTAVYESPGEKEFSDPDARVREWTGEVATVVPRSNWQEGSRSFPVIIRIRNEFDRTTSPPTPALREGMMAEAHFRGQEVVARLVPKDSMVRSSSGIFIFAVNAEVDGQPLSVRRIEVNPGISSGTWIQVNVVGEDRLEAGMQVVTEGAERLRPFNSVQILRDEPQDKAKDETNTDGR